VCNMRQRDDSIRDGGSDIGAHYYRYGTLDVQHSAPDQADDD
jgi:hypothetical protein